MKSHKWICAQIGAREHYAVARALHKQGRLAALCTDFWAGPVTRQIGNLKLENRDGKTIRAFRALAARYHPELGKTESGKQKAEIVSWNFRALWWERMLRRSQKSQVGSRKSETRWEKVENQFQLSAFQILDFKDAGGPYHGFIEVGTRFAIRVREALKRRTDLGLDPIFFAYDTGALEALEWCREQGVKCVLNQMDPNRVEVELVRTEEERWPGWALEAVRVPEAYFARREREWALADRVVVNSEFSRQALLRQGVSAEKLFILPLCYEVNAENGKQKSENGGAQNQFQISGVRFSASSPMKVLFLGQVILRKGIQYLIEAAKLLAGENIHFDVVGPIGISREAVASAPANMTFHGRTTRDQAADWYRQSHLFVLPTLSDGFAITQLEAMAHGLPVISTPCCGEVVAGGVDGFVIPARDAGALARTFQKYLAQPELLASQSAAALTKVGKFTLDRLAENLTRLETDLKES